MGSSFKGNMLVPPEGTKIRHQNGIPSRFALQVEAERSHEVILTGFFSSMENLLSLNVE